MVSKNVQSSFDAFSYLLIEAMTKIILIITVLIWINNPVASQQPGKILYRDKVYEQVIVTKNQQYHPVFPNGVKKKASLFDFYQATQDTNRLRPLVIWIHGGGFKFGSKQGRGIPIWCHSFVNRGYVCAAINYQKSKKKPLRKFADLAEGCYEAIRDLSLAIAYFKTNCSNLRIDTNHIILAGNSAGGMVALHAVYSSPSQLASMYSKTYNGTLPNINFISGISAVVNFWGAIFDTSWLQNASVPMVSIHGTEDNIVPFKHRDKPMYGSYLVHWQAEAMGIPNRLKAYEGLRHELQKRFNPLFVGCKTKSRWRDAADFAADFLYEYDLVSK